jgi:hypothetical protein
MTSCIVDSAAIYLWWSNLEILQYLAPSTAALPSKESCAVKRFKWNTVLYSRENPKRSLYCKMSVRLYKTLNVRNEKIYCDLDQFATKTEYYTKYLNEK